MDHLAEKEDWRRWPGSVCLHAGSGVLKGVLVADVEGVVDIVQDHIHAGEVVGGGVHLLAEEAGDVVYFLGDTEEVARTAVGS